MRLQILDGGSPAGSVAQAAARARAAGYVVVATERAARTYAKSTVFYTPGHAQEAREFQARFPVFSQVAPAPSTVSASIPLHVVLGQDYR